MHIVLVEPEIPSNTGNIARLCAATNSKLHLIEPLGFTLSNKELQRAGMDYWKHLEWHVWTDWVSFANTVARKSRLWLIEQGGKRLYTEVSYQGEDYLVFGRETAGLPQTLLSKNSQSWLRIPTFNASVRSLNLANCAALVLFEGLRQTGFPCEVPPAGTKSLSR